MEILKALVARLKTKRIRTDAFRWLKLEAYQNPNVLQQLEKRNEKEAKVNNLYATPREHE
jgi:predicted Fe-S protein YdhL (DUF1289 family)